MIFVVNFEKNKEFHLEKHKPFESKDTQEVPEWYIRIISRIIFRKVFVKLYCLFIINN